MTDEDVNDFDPAWQRGPMPGFLTRKTFDDFRLPKEVAQGIKDAGFVQLSPIQAIVIPVALEGKDVAGQAQTGTGKTAAFLVPLFARLMAEPRVENGGPCALIVAPTRELALQILSDAQILGAHTGFSSCAIVGGMDYAKQAAALNKGVDIVIGTPGRLIDYFKQKIFITKDIKIAVIDEADRLLDLGFAKDMRYILKNLPPYTRRQTMLFSATLSYRVLELTYEYMNCPEFLDAPEATVLVAGVEESLFHVGVDEKFSLLLGLLRREDWTRAIIFANMKGTVEEVARRLTENGFPAEGITGDLVQKKRLALMQAFKNGELSILVATDVASRGIHVEDISHVINYDVPQDPENYIHRIGRTARAGKTGKAITLACDRTVFYLEGLENSLGHKIPVDWPEPDWYGEDLSKPGRPFRKKESGPSRSGGRDTQGRSRRPFSGKRPSRPTATVEPPRPQTDRESRPATPALDGHGAPPAPKKRRTRKRKGPGTGSNPTPATGEGQPS